MHDYNDSLQVELLQIGFEDTLEIRKNHYPWTGRGAAAIAYMPDIILPAL